jgi:hypothetical protein
MMLFPKFLRGNLYTRADAGKSNAFRGRAKKAVQKTGRPSNAMPGPARDAAGPRDGLTHQIILM